MPPARGRARRRRVPAIHVRLDGAGEGHHGVARQSARQRGDDPHDLRQHAGQPRGVLAAAVPRHGVDDAAAGRLRGLSDVPDGADGFPRESAALAAGGVACARDADRRAELRVATVRREDPARAARRAGSVERDGRGQRLGADLGAHARRLRRALRRVRLSPRSVPAELRPRRGDAARHRLERTCAGRRDRRDDGVVGGAPHGVSAGRLRPARRRLRSGDRRARHPRGPPRRRARRDLGEGAARRARLLEQSGADRANLRQPHRGRRGAVSRNGRSRLPA
ncbi:Uncharacterised protein [Burkholderia pseudomallei]|nr:Uncharacterised protein [Burkholderia pseudomallei]